MNLIGKIINNSYIIRDNIFETPFYSQWIAHSIFSVNKFLLFFINTKKIKLNKDKILNIKKTFKDIISIQNENISNILEIEEYEDYIYFSFSITDGESLYNLINNKIELKLDCIIDIVISLFKLQNNFDDKKLIFAKKLIWIEKNNYKLSKSVLLNIDYRMFKELELMIDDADTDLNKTTALIFYKLLTLSDDINNASINIKKLSIYNENIKTKLIYIIDEFLKSKNNIDYTATINILNEIKNLYSAGDDKKKSEKKEAKTIINQSETEAAADILKKRIEYFQNLENERKQRMKNIKAEKINFTNTSNNSLNEDNLKLFHERRDYFEKIEKERWNYLRRKNISRNTHLDDLINETKTYYSKINSEDITSNSSKKNREIFLNSLSFKMKNYADTLYKESIETQNDIIKKHIASKKNEQPDKPKKLLQNLKNSTEYYNKLSYEMLEHFKNIANDLKKYNQNTLPDNRKTSIQKTQILKSIDNVINTSSKYYERSGKSISDNLKLKKINELVKEIEQNKEYKKPEETHQIYYKKSFADINKSIYYSKTLFKKTYFAKGNLCFIEKNSSKYIDKYFNKFVKYVNIKKGISISLKCSRNIDENIKNNETVKKIINDYSNIYKFLPDDIKKEITNNAANIADYQLNFLLNYDPELKIILGNHQVSNENNIIKNDEITLILSNLILNLSSIKKPLVIIINDFHFADRITGDVMKAISHRILNYPILIFCLYEKDKLNKNEIIP